LNILVTGSQGGIGSRLVEKLLEAGHTIRSLDQQAAPKGCTWEHHPGDIRDLTLMRTVMQDIDFVFHLAADLTDNGQNQERTYTVNVQGTWNVLMACVEAGVSKLVYFSSIQALGHSNAKHSAIHFPIDDNIPKQPATPYQISKHAAEEMCRGFTVNNDLSIVVLRPTFVFVPGMALGRWWRHLDQDTFVRLGSKDYWSFVHVEDVCQAAILAQKALEHDAIQGFQGFLLTADYVWVDVPTAKLVEEYYPHFAWEGTSMKEYLKDNPYRSLVDCKAAKETLGWDPTQSRRDAVLAEFKESE